MFQNSSKRSPIVGFSCVKLPRLAYVPLLRWYYINPITTLGLPQWVLGCLYKVWYILVYLAEWSNPCSQICVWVDFLVAYFLQKRSEKNLERSVLFWKNIYQHEGDWTISVIVWFWILYRHIGTVTCQFGLWDIHKQRTLFARLEISWLQYSWWFGNICRFLLSNVRLGSHWFPLILCFSGVVINIRVIF